VSSAHSLAPEAMLIVLVGAVFPPVCEVVKPCIKHSSGDIQGHRGIMEDAWLESVEGVGMGQCAQGVVLLPSSAIVQFLEIGQVLGQVSDPVVHVLEVLYFGV
jgi:hypothetical protein